MTKNSTALFPVFVSSAFLLGIYSCGVQSDGVKKTATPQASATPAVTGPKATETPQVVVPFTFAEAKPLCVTCHASTSGNQWNSAETEDGWIKKSEKILNRLAKNDMPPNGGLAEETKKKLTVYVEALSKKVVTPTPTPTPMPTIVGTQVPVTPFTLAEAELRCRSCHASTATGGSSATAKANWTFTIGTEADWKGSSGRKAILRQKVEFDQMPPGGLGAADRAKMLEFLK